MRRSQRIDRKGKDTYRDWKIFGCALIAKENFSKLFKFLATEIQSFMVIASGASTVLLPASRVRLELLVLPTYSGRKGREVQGSVLEIVKYPSKNEKESENDGTQDSAY
jgi:hypothetical protein